MSEYVAVIRDIPPNLLRPMIQKLAAVSPQQTFRVFDAIYKSFTANSGPLADHSHLYRCHPMRMTAPVNSQILPTYHPVPDHV